MQRRDFLKICFTALAGLFFARWLKICGDAEKTGLTEARFYRSSDSLPG